ncbi:ATP-binding protein [Embleya sp. NPDC059237]|uniref:ATP-binding protein n=1 Tax=Embleya sp. NPDC059237 TaxID=3346784 RepID=UPI0036B5E84C
MRFRPRVPELVVREPSLPLWPIYAAVPTGCAAATTADVLLHAGSLWQVVVGCAVSATTVAVPFAKTARGMRAYWYGRWDRTRQLNEERAESVRLAEGALSRLTAATRHLVEVRLPVVLEDPHARRADVPSASVDPCPAEPWASMVYTAHEALVDAVFAVLERERGRRENTHYAFLELAGRVRAQAQVAIADARQLRGRVTDSSLLEALMDAEHAWAQVGRAAQSLEVLSGGRPGRSWDRPLLLSEMVGAAQSRIRDYLRVSAVGGEGTAVRGVYAEALIHALAELLANATWFSPPGSTVRVQVERGYDGVSVTVEDAGLGMDPQTMHRAQQDVDRADADVSTLGGDPHFGLAVVGVLAGCAGFRVRYSSPGAYGGIRAVVWIPEHILTRPAPHTVPAGTRAIPTGVSARAGTPATATPAKPVAPAAGSAVLPQRSRRRAEASGQVPGRRDDVTAALGARPPTGADASAGPGSPSEGRPDTDRPRYDAFLSAFVNNRPISPDGGDVTVDAVPDITTDRFRSDAEGPTS